MSKQSQASVRSDKRQFNLYMKPTEGEGWKEFISSKQRPKWTFISGKNRWKLLKPTSADPLKALNMFGNCPRPVSSLGVSQHA